VSTLAQKFIKGVRWTFQIGGLPGMEQRNWLLIPYIRINPALIGGKYVEHQAGRRLLHKSGPLFRSDLDFEAHTIAIQTFERNDLRPRFYREVFEQGLGLRETNEFYYHMERIARSGETRNQCRTENDVLRYLEGKVRMFEEVRRRGELRLNRQFSGARRDEIGFLVDHQGNLVKGGGGNNRFAIARMLQLESVPVQIDNIHASQIPVIRKFKGLSAAAKINRYLLSLQERYARPAAARPSRGRTGSGSHASASREG
jgi:hypothetical protein